MAGWIKVLAGGSEYAVDYAVQNFVQLGGWASQSDYPGIVALPKGDRTVELAPFGGIKVRSIDERAVLLEGEGDELDTFYYMLQELDTVTGLITKNGTLAEAYTYDAYGKVSVWGYTTGDFIRDGDYFTSQNEFMNSYPSSPATDAMPVAFTELRQRLEQRYGSSAGARRH